MLRNVFRQKSSAGAFILGQLIICILLFGLVKLNDREFCRESDRINSVYQNQVDIEVINETKSDIFTDAGADVTEGNLMLTENLQITSDVGISSIQSEIILKANEELPYKMVSGRLPGTLQEDIGKRQVALGRERCELAYEENGKKYVDIEGEAYEVVGIIGSSRSDYWDNQVVLNVNCIGSRVLANIMDKNSYKIELSSNNADLYIPYLMLYGNIKRNAPDGIISSQKQDLNVKQTAAGAAVKKNKCVIFVIVMLFIFDCIVIVQWLINKSRKTLFVENDCTFYKNM